MSIRKNFVKYSINYLFIFVILTTFSLIGYFVFSSWTTSIERIIAEIQNNTNKRILVQIDEFINTPLTINAANHALIENDIIDFSDHKKREIYFSSVIEANLEDVYSFSYGTEDGEYYGARRNRNNDIEVYENTAATHGRSRYYSIAKDFTADQLVQETDIFDPRTRDWYLLAKEKGIPVFSPVYKHFVMNDLAISAACPIYSREGNLKGVIGTHLTLSRINSYLQDLIKDNKGIAYIIEKNSGYLIANSLDQPNFEILANHEFKRNRIEENDNKEIIAAYENYKENGSPSLLAEARDDKLYITVLEYKKEGLDWLIISAIPATPFTAGVTNSIKVTLFLSLMAILTAILLYTKSTARVLKPIYHLIETTEKFSAGDFLQRATIFRDDEIGALSRSFNKMAEQLHEFVNNLEEKIKERTFELEQINSELEQLNFELAARTQELNEEKDLAIKNYNELNTLHDIAANVQTGFLPSSLENEFVKVSHIFKPIQKLSGDMLDFTWFPESQKLCGFIVDVSGHGLIAALRTNILYGLLNEIYLDEAPIIDKMQLINQNSLRYFDDASYATIVFFEIDFKNYVLKLSSGGNNYLLASCQTKQGIVKLPGSLVGLFEHGAEYFELAIDLQPGDIFVFCSDGLFDLVKLQDITELDFDSLYSQLVKRADKEDRWDDASAICLEIKGEKRWPLKFELTDFSQLHFIRLRIENILKQNFSAQNQLLTVAIHEALNNAMYYSDSENPFVSLKFNQIGKALLIRIKQNGTGFMGNKCLQAIGEDFFDIVLEQEAGRGMAIMKTVMDRVIYNKNGTEILMIKNL